MATAKPSKNGLIDDTALLVVGGMAIALVIDDVESILLEDDDDDSDGDEGLHSRLCAVFIFLSFLKGTIGRPWQTTNVK